MTHEVILCINHINLTFVSCDSWSELDMDSFLRNKFYFINQ